MKLIVGLDARISFSHFLDCIVERCDKRLGLILDVLANAQVSYEWTTNVTTLVKINLFRTKRIKIYREPQSGKRLDGLESICAKFGVRNRPSLSALWLGKLR
jgi:hypothetical protein